MWFRYNNLHSWEYLLILSVRRLKLLSQREQEFVGENGTGYKSLFKTVGKHGFGVVLSNSRTEFHTESPGQVMGKKYLLPLMKDAVFLFSVPKTVMHTVCAKCIKNPQWCAPNVPVRYLYYSFTKYIYFTYLYLFNFYYKVVPHWNGTCKACQIVS